jgi:hypothetical protein
MDFGLGRFGDRRLEKGGPRSMRPWLSGRALVSGGLRDVDRRRCGSLVSFAIQR